LVARKRQQSPARCPVGNQLCEKQKNLNLPEKAAGHAGQRELKCYIVFLRNNDRLRE